MNPSAARLQQRHGVTESSIIDRGVREPHENPAIGVLLCASKDSEVVEYSMSGE